MSDEAWMDWAEHEITAMRDKLAKAERERDEARARLEQATALLRKVRPAWDDDRVPEICDLIYAFLDGQLTSDGVTIRITNVKLITTNSTMIVGEQ